jgi:uridine kinase
MKKTVYILRGCPGNGKTTLAEELCTSNKSSVICSADDYFTDLDGNYNWDAEQLGSAHNWCFNLFEENIKDETEIIIVANTNTRERDVNKYRNYAIENDYTVFVLTVENYHKGKNIHNVPEETIDKMKEQLKNSIKL